MDVAICASLICVGAPRGGNIKHLWNALNPDGDGFVTIMEFAPEMKDTVEGFQEALSIEGDNVAPILATLSGEARPKAGKKCARHPSVAIECVRM